MDKVELDVSEINKRIESIRKQEGCKDPVFMEYASNIADAFVLFKEMQPDVSLAKPSGLYSEVWQVMGKGYVHSQLYAVGMNTKKENPYAPYEFSQETLNFITFTRNAMPKILEMLKEMQAFLKVNYGSAKAESDANRSRLTENKLNHLSQEALDESE